MPSGYTAQSCRLQGTRMGLWRRVALALTSPLPPLQAGGPPGEVCRHSHDTVLCMGLSLSAGMAVRSQDSGADGRCGWACARFRRQQKRTQLAVAPHSSSRSTASRRSLGGGATSAAGPTPGCWAPAPWGQSQPGCPRQGDGLGKRQPGTLSPGQRPPPSPAWPPAAGLPWLSLQGWPQLALGLLPGHAVPDRLHSPVPRPMTMFTGASHRGGERGSGRWASRLQGKSCPGPRGCP